MVQRLLSCDLQGRNRRLPCLPHSYNEQTPYNHIQSLHGACWILCPCQRCYCLFRSLGGHFYLSPEEIGQVFSVDFTTPDGKRNILFCVFWKQTWPASCRLQSLTSFPFPLPAILDGRSKRLWHFQYVASGCICVHILHFCW